MLGRRWRQHTQIVDTEDSVALRVLALLSHLLFIYRRRLRGCIETLDLPRIAFINHFVLRIIFKYDVPFPHDPRRASWRQLGSL